MLLECYTVINIDYTKVIGKEAPAVLGATYTGGLLPKKGPNEPSSGLECHCQPRFKWIAHTSILKTCPPVLVTSVAYPGVEH